MVVGSAPVAPGILTFIRAALGTYLVLSNTSNAKYHIPDCVVVEGYGLTECAAPCTLTLPGDIQPGQVTNHSAPSGHVTPSSPLIGCRWGRPSPATWSSWRTWPRWSTSPRTARARSASGGPTCSRCWHLQNYINYSVCFCQGYFRDEARTQATLDPEGWLHTGDIGEWTRWAQLSSTCHHGYTLH